MKSISEVDVGSILERVRSVVGSRDGLCLLHGPTFAGNEWQYVKECIDTAWVSSAGSYVTKFEHSLAEFTGAKHAVAVVNGTAALHIALMMAGVDAASEVMIPSLTFVATANAVTYTGATPHFCDVVADSLGLDPAKLDAHLKSIAEIKGGRPFNRQTGRRIAAIAPMHTFGHPVDVEILMDVAGRWNIPVVEDAAESLGSYVGDQHTGTFGKLGILSFNGNKIITTGGGGAVLTDDPDLAARARHITTTAKRPHAWEFEHDEVGYNYRMPNINAALGVAQLEQLPAFLQQKRALAQRYVDAFTGDGSVRVFTERPGCTSNYWLNALILNVSDRAVLDTVLTELNAAGLQSRPIWKPMHTLPMYGKAPRMDLSVTEDLSNRIINVPSSAVLAGDAHPDDATAA